MRVEEVQKHTDKAKAVRGAIVSNVIRIYQVGATRGCNGRGETVDRFSISALSNLMPKISAVLEGKLQK